VFIQPAQAATVPTLFVEVGVALSNVDEVNVARALARPFTSIFEKMFTSSSSVDAALSGFPSLGNAVANDTIFFDLDHLVLLPEFVVVLSIAQAAGIANSWAGVITVVEGVSQDAILAFR